MITLSSWAAQRGSAIPSLAAYAASKAALANLTQTVARELCGERRARLRRRTRASSRRGCSEVSADGARRRDAVNAALAMGEMVPPEEVAELIAFLATGTCRHLSGATIDLNGASNIR